MAQNTGFPSFQKFRFLFHLDWKAHSQVPRNVLIEFELTDCDRCTLGQLRSQPCRIATYL